MVKSCSDFPWGRGVFLSDELYTEKEKKGVDRVERMNRFFDKTLMPTVGILIIVTLLFFIAGRFREKFIPDDDRRAASAVSRVSDEPEVFRLRRALLAGYSDHVSEFAAYGYQPVDGYSYELSLGKRVDDEMSIFQFSDPAIGQLTIINYFPAHGNAPYDSLSLAVSSHALINASVRKDGEKYTVTFTNPDFSSFRAEDSAAFDSLSALVDTAEMTAMYEIFETDIRHLAEDCAIAAD